MARRTPEQQIAALEARLARLKKDEKDRERRADTRRKIIAGGLALKHCRFDAGFRDALMSLLDQELGRTEDRALFGLSPLPSEGQGEPPHTWDTSLTSSDS
ncbi:MAG: mobilization protein [Rhizobium rhizophilum]